MIKEIVLSVIESERNYQENMMSKVDRSDMIELSLGDTLSAISYNLGQANASWYKDSTSCENTIRFLRKIAALAVQAGEKYGMPSRN